MRRALGRVGLQGASLRGRDRASKRRDKHLAERGIDISHEDRPVLVEPVWPNLRRRDPQETSRPHAPILSGAGIWMRDIVNQPFLLGCTHLLAEVGFNKVNGLPVADGQRAFTC